MQESSIWVQNLNITVFKNIFYKVFLYAVLLFSCAIRCFLYFQNRPLWHDECLLALNVLNRNFFEIFLPLDNNQSAPCLFMFINKISTFVFGESELALRLLPFLFSLASVFAFYFLTRLIFSKKISIVLANILFGLNLPLIYYSQEFKQYSLEVLVVILSLIFFSKFSASNMTYKKAIFYSFALFIPFLFSYTYVFILAAYLFYELLRLKMHPDKQFLFLILMLFTFGILSYFLFLFPQGGNSADFLANYWHDGFVKFDVATLLLFVKNLKYFFAPNVAILFIAILIFTGLIRAITNKNRSAYDSVFKIALLSLLFAIVFALFNIYPIKERLALWSAPILIIFISFSLDFNFKNSKKSITFFLLIVSFFIFGFFNYNFNYIRSLIFGGVDYVTSFFHSREDARGALNLIVNNYKNGDVIVLNKASVGEYEYYSKVLKFQTLKYVIISPEKYSKEEYFEKLNALEKGKTYIFCHSYDYRNLELTPFLNEWILSKAKKIHFIKYQGRTYVAKILL